VPAQNAFPLVVTVGRVEELAEDARFSTGEGFATTAVAAKTAAMAADAVKLFILKCDVVGFVLFVLERVLIKCP